MPIRADQFRFWATVSIDGEHIRDVVAAVGEDMATTLLTYAYSPELKAMYLVKPVIVTVEEEDSLRPSTS